MTKIFDNYVDKVHYQTEVVPFNKIGKVLVETGKCQSCKLEDFKDENNENVTYIVIVFQGGAMSVRNVTANSLSANLQELGQIINGGYYAEVDAYMKLKKEQAKH